MSLREGLRTDGIRAVDAPTARTKWSGTRRMGWKGISLALLLIALILLPIVIADPFQLRVLTISWLAAALTVGATISLGYAGLFNLSQGTFFGIGAYAAANILVRGEMPFEIAVLGSVAAGGIAGVALGLTSLRVRGDLWALVSMAFTVAMV